jgi:hypothetical protein
MAETKPGARPQHHLMRTGGPFVPRTVRAVFAPERGRLPQVEEHRSSSQESR